MFSWDRSFFFGKMLFFLGLWFFYIYKLKYILNTSINKFFFYKWYHFFLRLIHYVDIDFFLFFENRSCDFQLLPIKTWNLLFVLVLIFHLEKKILRRRDKKDSMLNLILNITYNMLKRKARYISLTCHKWKKKQKTIN